MPTITCDYCGIEFYRKSSRIIKNERQFCSGRCYGLARRARETRICPICHGEFIVTPSKTKIYCSPDCASHALRKRVVDQCRWCGADFERKEQESKTFCSMDCYLAWKRRKSERHWKIATCPVCEKEFEKRRSDTTVCCSWECGNLNKRQRIAVNCETCGAEFEATSSMIDRGFARFCSRACFYEWQKTRTGSLAANWRGGRTPQVYPKTFNARFRTKIRKRDQHTCAVCRLSGADVHHINYIKKETRPDNCITLCKSCHAKTNVNRDYWAAALAQLMIAREYCNAHD